MTQTFTWPDQISLRKYVFYLACSQQIDVIKGVLKKPFYLIPFNKKIKRVMTNECSEKQEYSDIFYEINIVSISFSGKEQRRDGGNFR